MSPWKSVKKNCCTRSGDTCHCATIHRVLALSCSLNFITSLDKHPAPAHPSMANEQSNETKQLMSRHQKANYAAVCECMCVMPSCPAMHSQYHWHVWISSTLIN